jgi:hypothetical protein
MFKITSLITLITSKKLNKNSIKTFQYRGLTQVEMNCLGKGCIKTNPNRVSLKGFVD